MTIRWVLQTSFHDCCPGCNHRIREHNASGGQDIARGRALQAERNAALQDVPGAHFEAVQINELQQVFAQTQELTEHYPDALILWNLLGASAAQLSKLDHGLYPGMNITLFLIRGKNNIFNFFSFPIQNILFKSF